MRGIRRMGNRVLSACMAIVLAVGLVPLPAYGEGGSGGSGGGGTAGGGSAGGLVADPAADLYGTHTSGDFSFRYFKGSAETCAIVGYAGSAASLDIPAQLEDSKALRTITIKSGSLTKTACKNLVKGTNVKTVKLSGKAAKSMRPKYAKWFPQSITLSKR